MGRKVPPSVRVAAEQLGRGVGVSDVIPGSAKPVGEDVIAARKAKKQGKKMN